MHKQPVSSAPSAGLKKTNSHCLALFALLGFASISAAQPIQLEWNRAMIQPTLARLEPDQTQKFKVILMERYLKAASAPAAVKWSVNDVQGGNSEFGRIDEQGVYHAPPQPPKRREVYVSAEVDGPDNRILFATVLIGKSPPTYRLVNSWSEPADKPDHFNDPHGICLDWDGNLLIADEGNSRVMRFTPEGRYLGDIGLGDGNEPGQFTKTRVVQVDPKLRRIWITDLKGDRPRLQVFDEQGKLIRICAEKGISPGFILRAHGIGIDPQHRVYTSDVDNFRVNIYTPEGEFIKSWGKPGLHYGELNAPHGMFVDRAGDVFITSYYGPTQKFDADGNFITVFGHGDPPDGPVYFHGMSGDHWGNIYLSVRNKTGYGGAIQQRIGRLLSIMKFNNNGDYITGWSLQEPDHKESWAVADKDGTVYSLFKGTKRMGVQVFKPE